MKTEFSRKAKTLFFALNRDTTKNFGFHVQKIRLDASARI